jgi:hypothetical protein
MRDTGTPADPIWSVKFWFAPVPNQSNLMKLGPDQDDEL